MKTIFTIVFTIIVLLTFTTGSGIKYQFETNNILITEVVGIGIPSFVLSIQQNNQLIKGHFIRNTFARAIPAAICLILAIGMNYILKSIDNGAFLELNGLDSSYANLSFTTFCALTMAVIALAMVFNCCVPLNTFRTILFITVIVLFLIMVFAFPAIPAVSPNPNPKTYAYWNFSMQISGISYNYLTKPMWFILIIYCSLAGTFLNLLLRLFKRLEEPGKLPIPFFHKKNVDKEKIVDAKDLQHDNLTETVDN